MAQFHFDPVTYLEMVRSEVRDYDTLQHEIARLVDEGVNTESPRVLDLGAGTGSTAQAVLTTRPAASLVLFDENPNMLAVAREVLPESNVGQIVIADLSDPLPAGPFDAIVSALAVHHLDGEEKRELFAAVHDRLLPGGRFAMADVVVPDDPSDAITPLSAGYDKPDRASDVLAWLRAAGFRAEITWQARDLAVFVADK